MVGARPLYAPARWFLAQALLATGEKQAALAQFREVAVLGNVYASEASTILEAGEPTE